MPQINTVTILGAGAQGTTGTQGVQGTTGSQGATGFQGIHKVWKTDTTNTTWIINSMNCGTSTSIGVVANRMYFICFNPAQNVVYSQLWMRNSSAIAGALCRILIYDDLNGKPNNKLYESADLDLSTIAQKITSVSGTFLAGVTYWLCIYVNTGVNITGLATSFTYPLKYIQVGNSYQFITSYIYNVNFNSAPTTLTPSSILNNTGATPLIAISMG